MAQMGRENQKIEIQLDPEIMKGVYSNVTNVGHTKEEFILDFLFLQQAPAAFGKMVSRVILSPGHTKRLLDALQENIRKYEEIYGVIDHVNQSPSETRTLQ